MLFYNYYDVSFTRSVLRLGSCDFEAAEALLSSFSSAFWARLRCLDSNSCHSPSITRLS